MKRKTAEVSSKADHLEESLLPEGPARKDLAAYVSLSSDSLVKQPGDLAIPLPGCPKSVEEAHASEYNRIPFHCSSEELQRRAIAP
ncbi:MAG: hypothetical protein HY244_00850 [Rhizobiales bacterium]|nr:hypothetical protein [Hyphomicrobiales bacterium]